ncbi:MAG: hypothetical protein MUC36_26215 [Planctomycetes bacterium]|jgi:hypothetical protein|nr:hypothetical protein [Planctomycetota bacterium]
MDVLLTCLHLFAYLALGFALAVPAARKIAIATLLLAAATSLGSGLSGPAERALETVHTYAGFAGIDQEVSMVRFPTGTTTAPGWQWPLPFVGFALLWSGWLWRLGTRPARSAWLAPLLFAWSASACWLAMQHLAAPGLLVQPVGLDRFLWPAGLAAALLAAHRAKSLPQLFVMVGATTLLSRLPAALFSKYASDHRLGTCLDISTIVDIVNPMTQMQFEPRLVAGTGAQQFWLIWLEHVIFFPAVYLMSLMGIAFGAYMFHRHGPETESQGR